MLHEKSKGDIIVYMDDDDYYPPGRVQMTVEYLHMGRAISQHCVDRIRKILLNGGGVDSNTPGGKTLARLVRDWTIPMLKEIPSPIMLAGCSPIFLYNITLQRMFLFRGIRPYHSTNNNLAYFKEHLDNYSYDDNLKY